MQQKFGLNIPQTLGFDQSKKFVYVVGAGSKYKERAQSVPLNRL